METIFHQEKNDQIEIYILRLPEGNEFVEGLLKFCRSKKIKAAWFFAIGAASKVTLGRFNFKEQKYEQKSFKEDFEITSLSGNVGTQDGLLVLHPHIQLARADLSLIGGHLNSLQIQGTCEIYLEVFDTEFRRIRGKVGLKLLTPSGPNGT